jgi:hypothetical protein
MRGFSEYIQSELGLPTRMLDPWQKISFGELQPPSDMARSMYTTVAGEAILDFKEIFS